MRMNKQEKALEILKGLELTTGNSNILKEPLQLAISALTQQLNDGWISVSERLPNEEECNIYEAMHPCHRQFICTVKIGEYEPQTRQLFFSKIFGWKYGPEDYNEHVIAWQPLPPAWKGENNEGV